MSSLHFISRMFGRIFTIHVEINHCDMEKNWSDFGDLELVFKVTGDQRTLKIALSEEID